MEIVFKTEKLRRLCCDTALLRKSWGKRRADMIRRRLDDLRAAPDLEAMGRLPGNCHELHGHRRGQLALNLDGAFRLVFEPAEIPIPLKPDGGLDRRKVQSVRILEVTDYHD